MHADSNYDKCQQKKVWNINKKKRGETLNSKIWEPRQLNYREQKKSTKNARGVIECKQIHIY